MAPEQALSIMRKEVGAALCPLAFAALEEHLRDADHSTRVSPLAKAS